MLLILDTHSRETFPSKDRNSDEQNKAGLKDFSSHCMPTNIHNIAEVIGNITSPVFPDANAEAAHSEANSTAIDLH
eukprot:12425526-Karenia_brevis.AAC.1